MSLQIFEDLKNAQSRDPAARSRLEVFLAYPGVHAIWGHRMAHWLWNHHCTLIARVWSNLTRSATGIEIHPGAVIGRRFFIDHVLGDVKIGAGAVIGANTVVLSDVVERANIDPSELFTI